LPELRDIFRRGSDAAPAARTFGFWSRLAAGAAMVVLGTAVATGATGIREVNRFFEGVLSENPFEFDRGALSFTEDPGDPQTILLIGSDTIGKGETEAGRETARSDTMILLRLDPESGATALLSLPRDLKVTIPGHGVDKLNAAYSVGGAELTLDTIKDVTGLPINHVVNVDFNGFVDVVDRLGCVYVDVDRRYYNVSPEFTPIDLQAGYQRLCGAQALAFARYRHEDTDIVRSARQQEFLRAFKAQNPVGKLIAQREQLIEIFGENTRSDLSSKDEVRDLLRLALASADKPIQEIHFEGTIGPSYVEASTDQMRAMTAEFIGLKASKGPRGTLTPADTPGSTQVGTPVDKSERKRVKRVSQEGVKRARVPGEGKTPAEQKQSALEDATVEGEAQAQQAQAAGVTFPVCYPTLRTTGSVYAGEPRVYKIGVGESGSPDRERFDSYRIVLKRGGVGEYYGIQGTTWRDADEEPHDPPILEDPTEQKTVNGRKFDLYYDGDRIRLVAWRTQRGVYWLSNTLLQTLSAKEMLKIAGNTRCE
jgi:polyisoprenyl-teichoic acid--peptidoglycan teichoic acid transferase